MLLSHVQFQLLEMLVVPFLKLLNSLIIHQSVSIFLGILLSLFHLMKRKKKLKDLCKTRWIQRIDSYIAFYELYPAILKTMESISECSAEYGN